LEISLKRRAPGSAREESGQSTTPGMLRNNRKTVIAADTFGSLWPLFRRFPYKRSTIPNSGHRFRTKIVLK